MRSLPRHLRIYRGALTLGTADFRRRFRDDATASLRDALAHERVRKGAAAAWWLWMRAMVDALEAVMTDRWSTRLGLAGVMQDVRLALRAARRMPQESLAIVGTLAVAIGGVAAVLMLADPILFRALPYRDPQQIVIVGANGTAGPGGYLQVPDYQGFKDAGVFADVTTVNGPLIARLVGAPPDEPELLGYRVSEGFMHTLGIDVQRGRDFAPEEFLAAASTPGATSLAKWAGQPALITDHLWRRLGGSNDVIGRPVQFTVGSQSVSVTVVGVLRPDFALPDAANKAPEFLVPGAVGTGNPSDVRNVVWMFARLRSDRSREATIAAAQDVLDRVAEAYPQFKAGRRVRLTDVREWLFRDVRIPLQLLLIVTVSVMTLAFANLVHLALARASRRRVELAVRSALGADRWRLVRGLIVESALLVVVGGACAIGVGRLLFVGVSRVIPRLGHVYRLLPSELNARIVAVVVVLVVCAAVTLGVVPAWLQTRRQIRVDQSAASMRVRGRGAWTDRALVALQAAIAAAVLIVTALLGASFWRLTNAVAGIDESDLNLATIQWPTGIAASAADQHLHDLQDRLQHETQMPIGIVNGVPGFTLPAGLWPAGSTPTDKSVATTFQMDDVAVATFRLQLMAGRLLTHADELSAAPVVVIDERTAALLGPEAGRVGQLVDFQDVGLPRHQRQIVGIVKRVDTSFGDASATGTAFVAMHPAIASRAQLMWRGGSTERVAQVLRARLAEIEPAALAGVRPFVPFERRFGQPRLLARLTGVLGAIAVFLTIAGIYAVGTHAVTRRLSEIGVRIALGASTIRVQGMVIRSVVLPALVGVLIGAATAAAWTKTLESLLFHVQIRDPLIFALVSTTIILIVALAALVPARRAGRVDPVEVLRVE